MIKRPLAGQSLPQRCPAGQRLTRAIRLVQTTEVARRYGSSRNFHFSCNDLRCRGTILRIGLTDPRMIRQAKRLRLSYGAAGRMVGSALGRVVLPTIPAAPCLGAFLRSFLPHLTPANETRVLAGSTINPVNLDVSRAVRGRPIEGPDKPYGATWQVFIFMLHVQHRYVVMAT